MSAGTAPPPGAGEPAATVEISDASRLAAQPRVSVIMTAFDHAPYIAEAIDGVLRQQAPFPFELIVAEDCSRDATREVAIGLQRLNPTVVRIVTGTGNVGGALNFRRAVARSRGKYIALCEGDDFWCDPLKLSRQVALLEADSSVGAVHSEFSHLVVAGGRRRILDRYQTKRRGDIPSGDVFDRLVLGNFIQTCTLCMRADLVRDYLAHPLSRRGNPVGDWPMSMYIAAHSSIVYTDAPTAVYRRVSGSATNLGPQADIRRARRSMAMIEDFCAEFRRPQSLVTESHANAYWHILLLSLVHGLREEFDESYGWLRRMAPHLLQGIGWPVVESLMRNAAGRAALAHSGRAAMLARELVQYRAYRNRSAAMNFQASE